MHLEIVKLLIDKDADIHVDDNYAFRMAFANGHLEVIKLLIAKGANFGCVADLATRNGCI